MSKPSLTIETITPELAQRFLDLNGGNRKVRPDRVTRYANEMREGRWQITGEPVVISNEDHLINGQHRLLAIIEADTPIQSAVLRGAEPDVYGVIDTGINRLASDWLAHDGIQYATNVAAASRLVLSYRMDLVGNHRAMTRQATHTNLREIVLPNQDRFLKLSTDAYRAIRMGFGNAAFTAFGFLLGERIGEEQADEWMHGAVSGANLEAGDPRLALRNWQRQTRKRQGPVELSAWIRARNAAALGETRSVIRPWIRGQAFPRLEEDNGPIVRPEESAQELQAVS